MIQMIKKYKARCCGTCKHYSNNVCDYDDPKVVTIRNRYSICFTDYEQKETI